MKRETSGEQHSAQGDPTGVDSDVSARRVESCSGDAMQTEIAHPHLRIIDPRAEKVRMLRERYLNGTLDEVLIPEDADFSGLVSAVFPDDETQRQ